MTTSSARRHELPALALMLTLLGSAAVPAQAQRDFSNVAVEITHVAGAVSMLTGAGGNIGVSAGADGILIVDDQFAELSTRIRAALDELEPGGPRFVINTHHHADHTGGNAAFAETATIVAHESVRTRLAQASSPREALPVVTFKEELSVHWNGEQVRVMHRQSSPTEGSQAHTDGDSIVWFTGSGVAHLGDLFFVDRFPFVDIDSGGDVDGLRQTIEFLIDLLPPDTKLIPGHGPLSTMSDLSRYQRMLHETTRWVGQQMGADRSLEQIQADGLPDEWDGWGDGFISEERWISMIHRAYTTTGTTTGTAADDAAR